MFEENYFKVRDPKAGETGWAFKREDGKIVLDSDFSSFRAGTWLVLEDDGYTIDVKATLAQPIKSYYERYELLMKKNK